MIGLFVTGTDTDVGKTFVTAAVARHLRRQGHRVHVSKPVATGAELRNGRLFSPDTLQLAEAAGPETDWTSVTPWTFAEPVAPAVAARHEGRTLDLEAIATAVQKLDRPDGLVLVEGVGGLLCPLTETATVADLAERLQLPLLIVIRNCLGMLNHTLLTLEVARGRGLPVAGLVVNHPTPPTGSPAESTNVEELKRRIAVPLLGVLPHHPGPATADWPELAAVNWQRLCGRG